jgi:uncharacterized protein (TIGR03086 family)
MERDAQGTTDIAALVERAAAANGRILAGIGADQWDLATPCPDWTVREVVRHLRHGVGAYLKGMGDPEALATDPAVEPPDGDLAAEIAALDARLLAALREPGGLERTVAMPYGPVDAGTIAAYRFVDLLVHGWDIARATGQPTDFAPELHEAALAMSRPLLDGVDRAQLGGMFADAQDAPAGCSAADRLAAYLGRAV